MAEETGTQENTAQENNQAANENQEEKKFTQTELDAIVNERLRRERKKYADYDDLKAAAKSNAAEQAAAAETLSDALAELATLRAEKEAREKADERAALAKSVAEEAGVDAEFLPLLTAEDEEGLKAQAALIAKRFAEPSKREGQKPADVGSSLADAFGEWAETQFQK